MKFMLLILLLCASGLSAQIVISPAPPNATDGESYSHQFVATGGTAPYTWNYSTGMPAGLSLNTSTGLLSGTPGGLSGPYNFVVSATDSTSATGQLACTIQLSKASDKGGSDGGGGCSAGHGSVIVLALLMLFLFVRRSREQDRVRGGGDCPDEQGCLDLR